MRAVVLSACMAGLVLADAGNAGAKTYDRDIEAAHSAASSALLPTKRQQSTPAPRPVDADRDGVMNRDEALSYYEALFAFLDGNQDGIIARAEFSQALATSRGNADQQRAVAERVIYLFGTLDADGDEKLTSHEFMGACDQHYDIIDVDGDGRVSVSEFHSRSL